MMPTQSPLYAKAYEAPGQYFSYLLQIKLEVLEVLFVQI